MRDPPRGCMIEITMGGNAVPSSLAAKKIVIAGGSGFLGISLAHHLAELGATILIISRKEPKVSGPWRHVTWDGRTTGSWQDEMNEAAGLVNLAGRSVNLGRRRGLRPRNIGSG